MLFKYSMSVEKKTIKKKIQRISVVDQVCEEIKQNIVDGVWPEETRLPSEGDFAEMFNVNRLSVRMALQKLNTLGIIETRNGEGSYVRRFSLEPLMHEIGSLYAGRDATDDVYKDIMRFRQLIEGDSLYLAAANGTDDEKAELKKLLDSYYSVARQYAADTESEELLDALVDCDLAFHRYVVEMSHNKIYIDVYAMVKAAIRTHIKQLLSTRIRYRIDNDLAIVTDRDTHKRIMEVVENNDTSKVQSLIYELMHPLLNVDYTME